ncbi:4932_t:CDS:2, partial [Scutellospora calospora]
RTFNELILLYNENNFGENLNFDNFDNSTATSKDSNNEQDMTNNTKLEKSKYNHEKYIVCIWCIDAKYNNIFVIGTQYFREQYLQQYIEQSDHKTVVYAHSKNQVNIISSIHQYTESNQLQIMRKMMNIYFLVKHNIATLNFENLCLLIELQIQNSNKNIILDGANFLNSPKPITTIQSICSEYRSYINDYTARQFILAIALFCYLGIIKLQSISSNAILNDLEQFILAKHLPHETLYHFGSDGHVNGIATQLKTHFLFLTEHHCISHHLALASKDAAEQTPYFETYDEIIQSNLDILQVIKTQWLSLSNVVNNLYQIINSVITDILSQLHHLSLVFQADYISVSEVTIQVNTVIESITADFISEANIQSTFGTILLQFMNQQNILPHDLPLFVQEFTINIVKNIKLRFSD